MAENNGTITIPAFDLKSWLTGFVLGLSGKPLPLCKRQPVAYLYNGIRLPALPEWDREMYPYAYIIKSNSSDSYFLCVYDDRAVYDEKYEYTPCIVDTHGDNKAQLRKYYVSNGEWAYALGGKVTTPYGLSFAGGSSDTPVWCNTDILNEDGTVYLPASEPVPVYE